MKRGRGFRELGVTFVVNDDVEAALELHADGVHLGQSDPGAVRARRAGLLLGRSASTLEQALAADADYLGVGAVWESPSKDDAEPAIGLTACARSARRSPSRSSRSAASMRSNAGDCIRAGAAGVAVIRAASDPALRQAVDEALGER